MSWEATAFVADLTENITRSEKMALLCLSNRHNVDEGYARPSIPNLARQALMSVSTCLRVLANLERKGFIRIDKRPGLTNHYYFVGLETTSVTMKRASRPATSAKTQDTRSISDPTRFISGGTTVTVESVSTDDPKDRSERSEPKARTTMPDARAGARDVVGGQEEAIRESLRREVRVNYDTYLSGAEMEICGSELKIYAPHFADHVRRFLGPSISNIAARHGLERVEILTRSST